MANNSPGVTTITSSTPTSVALNATTQQSINFWQTARQSFREYARSHERTVETVFEDTAAKDAQKQRQIESLWIRSAEKNAIIIDIRPFSISVDEFLDALKEQYDGKALGVRPVGQSSGDVAVIAFDTAEARNEACTIGVTVGEHTIIGTPALDANSQVVRLSLDGLPLLRSESLRALLHGALTPFGKVLHAKVYLDKRGFSFGKGEALIDVTPTAGRQFEPLVHEIHLGTDRLIYANWRGMDKHCFYCRKPGHLKANCPKKSRGPRTCLGCHSTAHLIRDCPKANPDGVGHKRGRRSLYELMETAQDTIRREQAATSRDEDTSQREMVEEEVEHVESPLPGQQKKSEVSANDQRMTVEPEVAQPDLAQPQQPTPSEVVPHVDGAIVTLVPVEQQCTTSTTTDSRQEAQEEAPANKRQKKDTNDDQTLQPVVDAEANMVDDLMMLFEDEDLDMAEVLDTQHTRSQSEAVLLKWVANHPEKAVAKVVQQHLDAGTKTTGLKKLREVIQHAKQHADAKKGGIGKRGGKRYTTDLRK